MIINSLLGILSVAIAVFIPVIEHFQYKGAKHALRIYLDKKYFLKDKKEEDGIYLVKPNTLFTDYDFTIVKKGE